MKINKVEIQNFYSIRNEELSFDDYSGLVLVKGKNKDSGGSNGSGKSALFEAVVWAIFGKTIRKSTEDALVNNDAGKKCQVSITLNDTIRIERGKKPSFLRVWDGETCLTQSSMAATQIVLEEILCTNYKVFLASMVFGQHNNTDFLGASTDDKRLIIRNFLNLEDLFKLRDKIRGQKSEYNTNIKNVSAVIDELLNYIDSLKTKLESVSNTKVKKSVAKILKKHSLEDILSMEALVIKLSAEKKELIWFYPKKNTKQQALEEKRDKNKCPTCLREYGDKYNSSDEKELEKENIKYLESVEKQEEQIKLIQYRIDEIKIPISSKEYAKNLDLNKASDYAERIKNKEARVAELDIEKNKNIKNYEIMRFWEKAFSESGLVKHIIKNVLDVLNDKCNTYLGYLTNGRFGIEFDSELNEKIYNNYKPVHYISLSGGERRKVNLAIMLGLQSLLDLTGKEQSNIFFMDEVAENVDDEGIQGLYLLLQELKKNQTIFLITHNKSLKTLLDSAPRITMIKTAGESKILRK